MKKLILTIIICLVMINNGIAQLTGVKTIDNTGMGDYISVSAAINDLNMQGVGMGGVTFNIKTGQTFSESPMNITASGTSSSPIVFQKSDAGSNPVIQGTTGTVNPFIYGAQADAVIKISGGDYITFDGINFTDNPSNTNNTLRMEYGILLVRRDVDTNACKFITIKNCKIELNKVNNFTIGILSSNYLSSNLLQNISTVDSNKSVSNLYITSDTITNSYHGIVIHGLMPNGSNFDVYDYNLFIGTNGGNVITGIGGGSHTTYGVDIRQADNFFISNNRISGGALTAGSASIFGINTFPCYESDSEINNNNISVGSNSESNSSSIYGIRSGANGVVKIFENDVNNCFGNGSFSNPGILWGIYQFASGTNRVEVFNNDVHNLSGAGVNFGVRGIQVNTLDADSINIYGNDVYNNQHTGLGFASVIYGIMGKNIHHNRVYENRINTSDISPNIIGIEGANVYNNEVYNNDNCIGIFGEVKIYNNKIYSLYAVNSGNVYGIYVNKSSEIYNNFIANLSATYGAPNTIAGVVGIYVYNINGINVNLYYNTVYINSQRSGITPTFSTHSIYYWLQSESTSGTLDMRNNIFVNISNKGEFGYTAAFGSTQDIKNNYSSLSNNNCFYVNQGVNNFIFRNPVNSMSSIGDFRNYVSPRDNKSVTEMPPFQNIAGNSPDIRTDIATQLNDGGTPVTSPVAVTTDIYGNSRSVTMPDIGAVEFNGISIDNDVEASFVNFSGVSYHKNSTVKNFTSIVRNNSNVSKSFMAYRKVSPGGYIDSVQITNLTTRTDTVITFKDFTFINNETYTITDSVYLLGDQIVANNVTSGNFSPRNSKTILLINGHNPSKNRFIDVLNDDGRFNNDYDTMNVNNISASLSNWKTVVVMFSAYGWDGRRNWTNALRDSMKSFLDNSSLSDKKTLIVFGNKLGDEYDSDFNFTSVEDTTFYRQYLKARYLQTSWGPQGKSMGGNPFSNDDGRIKGLGFFSAITDDTTETPYTSPDLISAYNGSSVAYVPYSESGDGDSAVSVVYGGASTNYNTFYTAITFSYFKYDNGGGGKSETRGIGFGAIGFFDQLADWVQQPEIGGSGSLPVELISFTGATENNNALLKWSTSMEKNNSGFEIQRKKVGENSEWLKVGFITGAGNSNEVKNYNFKDVNLNSGEYLYRLKQIDFNGNFRNYNLGNNIIIGVPKNYEVSQNYPNPFNPVTKIDFTLPYKSIVNLKIYDMLGREVYTAINLENMEPGYYTKTIDLSTLSSGVYFYRIIAKSQDSKEFVMTKRMVMVK